MAKLRVKRIVAIGSIVALVVIVGAAFVSSQAPPQHRVTIPLVGQTYPNIRIPTGNFPINESAATEYATDFINDYRTKANLEGLVTPQTSNLFPLYTSGSWEILVARDNSSTTNDWIEFLFVKQISGANPSITFYTNESAPYLRPLVVTGNVFNGSDFNIWTPYGQGFRNWASQNAFGITNFPLVWRANFTSVYGDTPLEAENAAIALYNLDVYLMTPHFPSWGWLDTSLGHLFDAAGPVAIIMTIWEFVLPRLKPPKPQRVRNPRKKEAKDDDKQKGQAKLD